MTTIDCIETAIEAIDEWISPAGVPGVSCAVWFDGEIVATRHAGEAHAGVPVDQTTLFSLASVTKPVTGAVVMTLVDRGLVSLDESISEFLPELVVPSTWSGADLDLESRRGEITTRQLLTHTSGLPEDLPIAVSRLRTMPTLEVLTDAMAGAALQSAPGEMHRYSNAGFAMLGRLVERVTGKEFWNAADELILGPLEMTNGYGRPPMTVFERIAEVTDTARKGSPSESYNSEWWRDLGLPWGGMIGSTEDLVRFAAFFLSAGDEILSHSARQQMTIDQLQGLSGGVQSLKIAWPVAWWGLGWEVKGSKTEHWTGDLTSPQTFCHFGGAGTLLWADPNINMAMAVFANRTTVSRWPFDPARWASLSNSLVAAVS